MFFFIGFPYSNFVLGSFHDYINFSILFIMNSIAQKREQTTQLNRKTKRAIQIAKRRGTKLPDFADEVAEEQQPQELDQTQIITDIDKKTQQETNQEENQKNQEINQDQQLTNKISNLQKTLDQSIKITNPREVYETIKKQIQQRPLKILKQAQQQAQLKVVSNEQASQKQALLQKKDIPQQIPLIDNTNIYFSRANYRQIIHAIIQQMNFFTQTKQYEKNFMRMTNIKQRRLFTNGQLKARIKLLYSKLMTMKSAEDQFNQLKIKLKKEEDILQTQPKRWFNKFLRTKLKLTKQDDLYKKMKSDPAFMERQVQNRKQVIKRKLLQIYKNFEKWARTSQKVKLNKVKRLSQLQQSQSKVHVLQKQGLVYMIDGAEKQIQQLNKDIVIKKQQFQDKQQQLLKQNDKIRENLLKQQQQFKGRLNQKDEIIKIQNQKINIQNDFITQQNIKINEQNYILTIQQSKIIQLTQENILLRQRIIEMELRQKNIIYEAQQQFLKMKQLRFNQLQMMQQKLKTQKQKSLQQLDDLLKQKINDKKLYQQKLKQYEEEHINFVQLIKEQTDNILTKKLKQSQIQFQQRLLSMRDTMLLKNRQFQILLKQNEVNFKRYQKNKQQQIKVLKQSFQTQLQHLLRQTQQQKLKSQQFLKKKQDLENKIKKLKQQQQFNKSKYERLSLQNKEQLDKIKQTSQKQKKLLQTKLKQKDDLLTKLRKQKQQQIDKLKKKVEDLQQQKSKQIESRKKAQQQKRISQQKAAKIAKNLVELQQVLTKFKQKKLFELTFKRWQVKFNYTIRQCFKRSDHQKWIATTRGINYTKNGAGDILQIFKYWQNIYQNKLFPTQKVERKLRDTNIVMILDKYKGQNYYSLRQCYYVKGQFAPTRRGFNISQSDLPYFFSSINQFEKLSNIQNIEPKQFDDIF